MGFRTPYIHIDKHTHMRARVLADHRDVGLLRNTGIDPCILPSASEEATVWIRVCNYFNLTVCKWMLAPQRLEVLCSSRPLKNALRQR